MLAAVETRGTSSTADDENYWFVYDGNGNVGQVLEYTTDPTPTAKRQCACWPKMRSQKQLAR